MIFEKVVAWMWNRYQKLLTVFSLKTDICLLVPVHTATEMHLQLATSTFLASAQMYYKYTVFQVRFKVLVAASMKVDVFWDVAPCSLVDIDWHFRGAYCLHHQGDEEAMRGTTSQKTVIFKLCSPCSVIEIEALYKNCMQFTKINIFVWIIMWEYGQLNFVKWL
jgi:hypothetical protein